MCRHGEVEIVQLPSGSVAVDRCLAKIVKLLNADGIRTATCCCGHGRHDGFIKILEDGQERLLIVAPPGEESRSRYFSDFEPMARKFGEGTA